MNNVFSKLPSHFYKRRCTLNDFVGGHCYPAIYAAESYGNDVMYGSDGAGKKGGKNKKPLC
jgi:hypothetical protein